MRGGVMRFTGADFTVRSITEQFEKLGEPGQDGLAFAITANALVDNAPTIKPPGAPDDPNVLSGTWRQELIDALPRPSYPHRIYHELRTDNYLVVRANSDGTYWDGVTVRAGARLDQSGKYWKIVREVGKPA